MKVNSSAAISLVAHNCRKVFAHFGQVYLMCLIFVKDLPILGKVD